MGQKQSKRLVMKRRVAIFVGAFGVLALAIAMLDRQRERSTGTVKVFEDAPPRKSADGDDRPPVEASREAFPRQMGSFELPFLGRIEAQYQTEKLRVPMKDGLAPL